MYAYSYTKNTFGNIRFDYYCEATIFIIVINTNNQYFINNRSFALERKLCYLCTNFPFVQIPLQNSIHLFGLYKQGKGLGV